MKAQSWCQQSNSAFPNCLAVLFGQPPGNTVFSEAPQPALSWQRGFLMVRTIRDVRSLAQTAAAVHLALPGLPPGARMRRLQNAGPWQGVCRSRRELAFPHRRRPSSGHNRGMTIRGWEQLRGDKTWGAQTPSVVCGLCLVSQADRSRRRQRAASTPDAASRRCIRALLEWKKDRQRRQACRRMPTGTPFPTAVTFSVAKQLRCAGGASMEGDAVVGRPHDPGRF